MRVRFFLTTIGEKIALDALKRMARADWKFAAVDGLCEHGGLQHEGRDSFPKWRDELHQDNLAYLRAEKMGYQGYSWWRTDI